MGRSPETRTPTLVPKVIVSGLFRGVTVSQPPKRSESGDGEEGDVLFSMLHVKGSSSGQYEHLVLAYQISLQVGPVEGVNFSSLYKKDMRTGGEDLNYTSILFGGGPFQT